MKAIIRPIEGKYYGTEIDIQTDSGREAHLRVWVACGEPSIRELQERGFTKDDWENNVDIDDGWGGKEKIRNAGFLCDSHYECKESLEIAQKIVSAINDA